MSDLIIQPHPLKKMKQEILQKFMEEMHDTESGCSTLPSGNAKRQQFGPIIPGFLLAKRYACILNCKYCNLEA